MVSIECLFDINRKQKRISNAFYFTMQWGFFFMIGTLFILNDTFYWRIKRNSVAYKNRKGLKGVRFFDNFMRISENFKHLEMKKRNFFFFKHLYLKYAKKKKTCKKVWRFIRNVRNCFPTMILLLLEKYFYRNCRLLHIAWIEVEIV